MTDLLFFYELPNFIYNLDSTEVFSFEQHWKDTILKNIFFPTNCFKDFFLFINCLDFQGLFNEMISLKSCKWGTGHALRRKLWRVVSINKGLENTNLFL